MYIFFLFAIILFTFLLLGRKIFNSAKRNLFKDHAAWSGKEIKINYTASREISESKENRNYLKIIADESKIYLDNQSYKEEQE